MIEDIIRQASVEDKKVLIQYQKDNGEVSDRVIGSIVPSEKYGDGYIEAFCYKRNDQRTFRIDRIMDAKIIDESDFVPRRMVPAPLVSVTPQPHSNNVMEIPAIEQAVVTSYNDADPKLRQLCQYYLNCIALENANSISTPKLVNEDEPQFVEINTPFINGIIDEQLVGFITNNTRQRKTAMVGYPVMVSDNKIIPLLLFQVTADYGVVDMSITPFVNKAIVDLFISDSEEQMQELLFIEEQLGLNNDNVIVDIKSVANSLKDLRPNWQWKEDPNPDTIEPNESISLIDEDGIYNRCVLMQADLNNYTMGLEMELNALSKISKESYKDTALYQWMYAEVGEAERRIVRNTTTKHRAG